MGCLEDLFDEEEARVTDFRSERKKRVGVYVLGRTLGEGAFAKVRLGVHLVSREKVAVKVVNKRSVMKREYAKRNLHREAAMLQRLDHPNIIKLYEVLETDNHYYIVTELADGCDFMEYISDRCRLCEDEARTYMRQIVSAVDHMHRSGVIHRDLKIENIMFDKAMKIKIIDLGLGNSWDGHNLLSTQCGSPAYAAPEIFSKKPYGPAVDLWSIGVNMYAMLTGELPFTVDPPNSLTQLHATIMTGCKPPPDVSKECQDVLLALLDIDGGKRMTMAELKAHPWILSNEGPLDTFHLKSRPQPLDLDEVILAHMVKKLGMDDAQTRDALLNNKVNAVTATYQLLYKHKMNGMEQMDPGMYGMFLTQKLAQPNYIGPLESLQQREPLQISKNVVHGADNLVNVGSFQCKQNNVDGNEILQRYQLMPSHILNTGSESRIGLLGSNPTMSQFNSKTHIEQLESWPGITYRPIHTMSQATNLSDNGQSENIKLHKQSVIGTGIFTNNCKDCVSKLRLYRGHPSRNILQSEEGKPIPIKPVAAMEIKVTEAPPPTIAVPIPVQTQGQVVDTMVMERTERDNMVQLKSRCNTSAHSAGTKTVHFNVQPDSNSNNASMVVSIKSKGSPSQTEWLVIRRSIADKMRQQNIPNRCKVHYHKKHWKINHDAIDNMQKHGTPVKGSLAASGSLASTGSSSRTHALRVLQRSGRQNALQPTPNSVLGHHKEVPINKNIRYHPSSANASAASSGGIVRGQHHLHLVQSSKSDLNYHHQPGSTTFPSGHLLQSFCKVKHFDKQTSTADDQRNHNFQFHMCENGVQIGKSEILVWDQNVLDPACEARSHVLTQRSGSVVFNSPSQQHQPGPLRGHVPVSPKSNYAAEHGDSNKPPELPVPLEVSHGTAEANQRTVSTKNSLMAVRPLKFKMRAP